MEIIVKKESIELNAIYDLLVGYQNQDSLKQQLEQYNLEIPKECLKVYKDFDKIKAKYDHLLKYYFRCDGNEEDFYSLASFTVDNFRRFNMSFTKCMEYMESLSREEFMRHILTSIIIKDNSFEVDSDYTRAKDIVKLKQNVDENIVMAIIDKSSLPYSLKWKLYKAINSHKESVDELIYVLEGFKNSGSESLRKITDRTNIWALELEGIIRERGIDYLLSLNMDVDYSSYKRIYIAPVGAYKCYNLEGLSVNDDEFEATIGYNIEKTMERFRRGKSDEWFMDVLKLLADPTRYKILKLLSKKDMYSGELAIETGMSQGTISHHMSNLVLYDLVCDTRKDGRVYYELNKEKFKMWVSMLRKKL